MTDLASQIGALLAAGTLAAGGLLGAGSGRPAHDHARTAVIVDAGIGAPGRSLIDPRLRHLDADVRLPHDLAQARTDVRYFQARGYDVLVVAGPRSTAAAATVAAPTAVRRAADIDSAIAALAR